MALRTPGETCIAQQRHCPFHARVAETNRPDTPTASLARLCSDRHRTVHLCRHRSDEELVRAVKDHLGEWFGREEVAAWEPLR